MPDLFSSYNSWLRITKETDWGVRKPSPGAGDVHWIGLEGDDAFKPVKAVQPIETRAAHSKGRRLKSSSKRYTVSGPLRTKVYTQYLAFLKEAAEQITSGSGLAEHEDLPSYTVDFCDGTTIRSYYGGKVGTFSTASSNSSPELVATLGWVFKSVSDADLTISTFPKPSPSVFPPQGETALDHSELCGGLKKSGVSVPFVESLNVSVDNGLQSGFFDCPTITYLRPCNRDATLQAGVKQTDQSFRDAYESQSPVEMKLEYERVVLGSGGSTTTYKFGFDFKAQARVSERDYSRPLNDVAAESFTVQSYWDVAAGTDLVITASETTSGGGGGGG